MTVVFAAPRLAPRNESARGAKKEGKIQESVVLFSRSSTSHETAPCVRAQVCASGGSGPRSVSPVAVGNRSSSADGLPRYQRGSYLLSALDQRQMRPQSQFLPLEPHVLVDRATSFLQRAIKGNTKDGYASSYHQYEFFKTHLPEALLTGFPEAMLIVFFIQTKIERKSQRSESYIESSQLQDIKNIRAVLNRVRPLTEEDVFILRDASKSLVNAGAKIPQHQAKPMTKEHFLWLIADPTADRDHVMLLILMWRTCSRWEDGDQVLMEHVTRLSPNEWPREDGEDIFVVKWPMSPKNPFRTDTIPTVLSGDQLQMWRRWMTLRGPRAKWATTTPSSFTAFLQKADPAYGMHSVKRGSLLVLLKAGVGWETLKMIAKHQDLSTLLRYLPRHLVALHFGLAAATRLLQ